MAFIPNYSPTYIVCAGVPQYGIMRVIGWDSATMEPIVFRINSPEPWAKAVACNPKPWPLEFPGKVLTFHDFADAVAAYNSEHAKWARAFNKGIAELEGSAL